MDFSLFIALTFAICLALFFRLRVIKRRARLVNWLFIYPGALLLLIYAWFFGKWLEVGAALIVAALIVIGWWLTYGSYLPAASDDNISVWGQEAKKPAVVAAEAQAEVERLKKEKEELEKELERLKKQTEEKDEKR